MSDVKALYDRLTKDINSIKQPHFDIAYCLSEVRKNGWYTQYDCYNIYEFAEQEFSLGKTSVKNYLAVSDKFMNGEQVIELFVDYSYTALVEMSSMSVHDWQFIKPDMSIKDIRTWKHNHKFVNFEGNTRLLCDLTASERKRYEQSQQPTHQSRIDQSQSTDHLRDVQPVVVVADNNAVDSLKAVSLKNNSDRTEFLKNYKEWCVWVSVPELYLTVYRYNFANGISICATEFSSYDNFTYNMDKRCQTVRYQIIDNDKMYDLAGISVTEVVAYLSKRSKDL